MQFIRSASDQSKLAAMRRMREDESRTAMLKCLFIAVGIVFGVSMFLGTFLPLTEAYRADSGSLQGGDGSGGLISVDAGQV
mmetsp:Transcript_7680/g.6548  ORF Transcript_7680/g.6548 Transcript_7680/m.6548 type:complete len:81 (-) Transcript_7680:87-329(-)